ncbi:MAG: histidinol-phosphate transaminase [Rhodobacteraceae bacterium]|nr:histidinol-phosphate transaminase [Paracoccaceae bacterium]
MPGMIEPKPGILDIHLYVGGDAGLQGFDKVLKLSSNESPIGPSAKAIAAYQAVAGQLQLYPSSDHAGLRKAIAKVHGVDADRVICGDGSDEVLAWLGHAYAGPGDEVLYTEHGFLMYEISARAAGATPVKVPETDRLVDVDKLLAACNERTRLVFIANPGNPTGTMLDASEVARLADNLPRQTLLVLDGAYAEFVPGFDGGISIVEARQNVVMTRTFSKIYGLGGLRVGWGYGPKPVIDVLNRLRGPFNVTAAGLAAAEAAVLDIAHTDFCRAENAKWRDWLQGELASIGIPSDPSSANFFLARFRDADQAVAADASLRARGVIVRRVAGYGFPEALRITVGTEEACRKVAGVLAEFMDGQG